MTVMGVMRTRRCRVDRVMRAIHVRLFEWAMALILVGVSFHLAIWPQAVAASSLSYILDYVPEQWLGLVFCVVGLARIAALIVNGHSPDIGPKVRGIGSICGAVIWAQMAAALYIHGIVGNLPPSPGISVYAVLTLAELVATFKAAADVRVR